MFLLDECLKGPVTDGPHGMVGNSRDEDGEELIRTGLDDETLVVLRAGEHLRHWVLALNTIKLILSLYLDCRLRYLDMRRVVWQESSPHLKDVRAGGGTAGEDGPHHGPVESPRYVQLTGQAEAAGVLLV